MKSLKDFKNAELTSEEASNVNGSSRTLDLLREQNSSYLEQIRAIRTWFRSVGISEYKSYREKIRSNYNNHRRIKLNIIFKKSE